MLCGASALLAPTQDSAFLAPHASHDMLWRAFGQASQPHQRVPTPHSLPACSQSVATNSSIDPLPGPPIGYPRVPGSFESLARDVRLRMLLSAACYEGGEYPTSQSWAPQQGGVSSRGRRRCACGSCGSPQATGGLTC